MDALAAKAQHDEGRVLVIEFEHFVLLNTYAQNNGWSPESFAKRRRWDAEVDGEFFYASVRAIRLTCSLVYSVHRTDRFVEQSASADVSGRHLEAADMDRGP